VYRVLWSEQDEYTLFFAGTFIHSIHIIISQSMVAVAGALLQNKTGNVHCNAVVLLYNLFTC